MNGDGLKEWSIYWGLDAKHRAERLVGQRVQIAIGSRLDLAYALFELREKDLAAGWKTLGVELHSLLLQDAAPLKEQNRNCDILYAMQAILTFVVLVSLTGTALAQSSPAAVAPEPTPFYAGVSDTASMRAIVEQRAARADGHLKALLDVQGARTVESTLVPYDRMGLELEGALRMTRIVARLHPDESMRMAAEELGQGLAEKSAALELRPDIYSALRAIDLASVDPATRRYVTRELRDLELAGVSQPEDVRARLTRLQTELSATQQEFNRNLLGGQRRIVASASEIEGLPQDFIAAKKPDTSGSITLTTDDVDMQVVSSYARSEALRKRLQMERWNVAAPQNVKVLERLVAIRHEIATLLGYPTWAEYHARPRMAGDAKTVTEFIDRVFTASNPPATREYAELLARKKQDVLDATTLESWDRTYYADQVRRARYSFDSQSVRPYFPYERVRSGVMDVASRLFDVTFRPAPGLPTWHPSVESYEVLQGGTLVGRLYLDVHPRTQKANSGASVSTVRRGARGVQIPEAVLTASVPGGVPGDPGLMTHDQVRTLFHEFGHVVHAIVAGQGRWNGINGIDIEGDVAEAPSTMLEEWIWDAPTLATFARHYQTNQPIPADLVQQMRRAGEFGKGLDAQRQAFLAKVSLSLHDKTQSAVDSTAIVHDVSLKYNSLFPWTDGTYLQAQFTHLANGLYTSSYYTYLWSRVVAKDLFSQFDPTNLLAPAVAHRYRDTVLVPGGSKPAADLIGDFLGRPFRFDAYERWLNGDDARAKVASVQSSGSAPQSKKPIALVGGTLIDGTGGTPIRNSVILVRGDRIERIGTVASLPVPSDYEQISTEGMTVLPGLWDLHVHLIYNGHPNPGAWFKHAPDFERVTIPASAQQMLMGGVTSVRDMAAPADAIFGVKKRIAAGEIPGSTIYAAGPALAKMALGAPAPTSQFLPIADAADARAKARQLLDQGADLIKMFFTERMSPEERRAIITEAHARGKKVAMHGQNDAEVRLGLQMGIDDFQHIGVDSPEYAPDIMASLRERVKNGPPLYWTPTVGANNLLNGAYTATKPEIVDDPEAYLGLPAALVSEIKQGWDAYQPRAPRADTEAIVKRKIAQLQEVGVTLLFGSDEGSAGELARHATWMDADLWVRVLGMDPMIVLQRMTLDAAKAMGADRDNGSIAAGKYADVIAVGGDPLRHIDVLRDPKVVIKHGQRYK